MSESGPTPNAGQLTGGHLNWAIANAAVRVHSRFLGRGPTKTTAFYRRNLIVVLMQGLLTPGELTLVGAGRLEAARQMRREFERAIENALVAEVEGLTRQRVLAFMSDHHVDPDLAVQLYVLDHAVPGTLMCEA